MQAKTIEQWSYGLDSEFGIMLSQRSSHGKRHLMSMLRSSPSHPSVASPLGLETPYSWIGGPRGKGMICGDIGNLQAERDDPWQVSDIPTFRPLGRASTVQQVSH